MRNGKRYGRGSGSGLGVLLVLGCLVLAAVFFLFQPQTAGDAGMRETSVPEDMADSGERENTQEGDSASETEGLEAEASGESSAAAEMPGEASNGAESEVSVESSVVSEVSGESSALSGSEAMETSPREVEALIAEMTLREKVYQLFIVYPSSITGIRKVTQAGEKTREALESYPVGGLLYDKSNMVSQEQVRTMLETVQSYTRIPLILTCDEEGGRVNRLMDTVGTTRVGPMYEYREEGPEGAERNAGTIAADLSACGFNMDLAPVADVWSNPDNTVIGDRAYSDDFEQAAELVAAAVRGFRESGVACTLKHFPGHGDTSADSHNGSVYVYKTLEELRAQELIPFQAGIDAGADAVMMGHLIIADVEEEPALFSYRLVTELLREEMGFAGVVMSDSLQMKAMTKHYGSGEIAVKAVKAGVDVLLCPEDLEEAAEALIAAVESGEITQERLEESVRRILTLKYEYGLL